MTKVQIIAHRGASHDAPENTAAAIRLGWEQHADTLEIDIHLSKDGQIIVIHDATTQRTTGVEGEVAAFTLEELQQLDAGSWKDAAFAGERILTLGEVLALLPPEKSIVIEIKSKDEAIIAPLGACLLQAGVLREQITLVSFDYELIKKVKAALPQWEALWVHGAPNGNELAELIALCREANLDGLNLPFVWPIDAAFMHQIRSAGMKLLVWTVDDGDVARSLAAAGVDGIMTNRPAWLRERLQRERV